MEEKKSGIGFNSEKIASIFDKAKMIKEGAEKPEAKTELVQVKDNPIASKEIKPGYIGLNGIRIREDGTITKDKFMSKLAPQYEKYPEIQLTEAEAIKVKSAMNSMTAGVNAAVPLTCTGHACAFKNTCPYYQINKAPLGRPCLVESQLIEYWTEEYLNEFSVDPSKLTEMHLVSELAELNIYEMRITKYIAENHQTLLQDIVTGVDPAGNIITNLDVSKSFELKDRIKKQRMKVLEALMATRRERVKAVVQVAQTNTTAQKISELKQQMEKISKDIANSKITDGDFVEV